MKDLVLIGAGHTHVQVLKRAAMEPLDARITLIVDRPEAVYSGMVPGLVAGDYHPHELTIDAHPLARRAGVRVVHARATRIDPTTQEIQVAGRPPIRYDLASLNIGSTVAGRDQPGVREHAVATRPIHRLVSGLEARIEELGPRPSVAVVGAGAGGVELAFCLDARLRALGRSPTVHLLYRSDRPLPGQHDRVRRRVVALATGRGIRLHPETSVEAVTADGVVLEADTLAADLVVWVTGAAGLPFARESGLPTDDRGFVWIDDTLQVEGHPTLFAAGDCAVLRSWPGIPKAGVYAVRQGPVLDANLRAALAGEPLSPYRPQRDFFSILNLGDGTALGAKWGLANHSGPMFAWKDWIDRRFMTRFQVLDDQGAPTPAFATMGGMEGEMVCGGCAAKVAQQPLERALSRLEPVQDDRIVLGPAEADDVVAWREEGRLTVQNVDAFRAPLDDPWWVGRIAAHNATSDLWAKAVRPAFAMALVQIPFDADPEDTLFQVMAGLRHSLDADGIPLLGGHTTLGDALSVGLAVTGHPARIPWTLAGARPGDGLVLTRPLGTGVLFHADMAGRLPGPALATLLESLGRGNRRASELARPHPIHAATDVTGFGLAGHLVELLRASGVAATVALDQVPLHPEVERLLTAGERSTFHDANRVHLKTMVVRTDRVAVEALFDPQTAGGLLFATPQPDRLVDALREGGETAWVIGSVTEARDDHAWMEVT
jgi:selenide,water dikinase